MAWTRQRSTRPSARGVQPAEYAARCELERRLEQVLAQLETARRGLHKGRRAVCAAEETLLGRRQEFEQAAELVADLATLAESLERSLSRRA